MDRKEFIRTCSLTCLGSLSIPLLQSCGAAHYAQSTLKNNELIIRKTEFMQVQKGKNVQRKYVLLKSDQFNYPLCIYRLGEDSYSALLMECTHKGCELRPHGDYLVCPCHGSEFSNKGTVQNPPAEENLKTFQTKSDNENIYIIL
jgi:cytochrome b6-f complex iron-sulfur subunit